MKKIAILTRRAGYNMGSSLQAFAMSKFIGNEGYDARVLNYDEYAHSLSWRIKPLVFKFMYVFLKSISFISKRFIAKQYIALERRFQQISKFEDFERQYMQLTKEKYRNSNDLRKVVPQYDAFVCGSDQIWNPAFFDPCFFFDFVSDADNVNTVAYSPSIGVTERESLTELQQEMTKRIRHISCREKEGAKVLSDICGRDIPVTLDPTLMLSRSDWDTIATKEKLIEGEYILCYFLHNDYFIFPDVAVKYVEKLRENTGLKVVNIQMFNLSQIIDADTHLYDCNPSDFISLIANATYVCTNSFHCCVFSFLYDKRFFVFERYSKEQEKHINQNPRIYTLLNIINSEESLITDCSLPESLDSRTNYNRGNEQLHQHQELSREYINKSLCDF